MQSCCSRLQLLLHDYVLPCDIHVCSVRLSYCSRPPQLLLPNRVCFRCCSPIVSASAAAPRLCPLRLLLPDCVCLNSRTVPTSASYCSPVVSVCNPSRSGRFQPLSNVLNHSSQSLKFGGCSEGCMPPV